MENEKDTHHLREQSAEPGPLALTVRASESTEALFEQIQELFGKGRLDTVLDLLAALHPSDKGEILTLLDGEHTRAVVKALGPEETADILEHLDTDEAVDLSGHLEPQVLANILDATSPDVAADVLRQMSEPESDRTLRRMWEADQVVPLMQYRDDTAGGRMTTRYLAVDEESSITNVLGALRENAADVEDETALWVVNQHDKLVGAISVVRVALANPNDAVKAHMSTAPLTVCADVDQEECARMMERYDLTHMAVVDFDGRLLGVLLDDDLVDVLEEEATEDMYRMAGISGDSEDAPMWRSARSRLPWLYINLATVFIVAVVISLFESTIARLAVLAAFLPVIMGQAGVGGLQSFTLVVRGMALGEIKGKQGLRMMGREGVLGVIQGLLVGAVVTLIAGLWQENWILGGIVGIAMVANMFIGSVVGTGIPLLLRRIGVDPAVASAVFITTITDVLGALLTLGLAALLIESLL